jgi:hypothetical protein
MDWTLLLNFPTLWNLKNEPAGIPPVRDSQDPVFWAIQSSNLETTLVGHCGSRTTSGGFDDPVLDGDAIDTTPIDDLAIE